jgi:hypothetical protein
MNGSSVLCHRCGIELHPGSGDFYVVRIEAVADPSGPVLEDDDPDRDIHREIEELVKRMSDLTEQEAMDQVYRRLTLHLCTGCYRAWIEDPTV